MDRYLFVFGCFLAQAKSDTNKARATEDAADRQSKDVSDLGETGLRRAEQYI